MKVKMFQQIKTIFHRNLLAQKGAFADFLIQYIQENHEDIEELAEIQDHIEDEELKNILQRQTSVISNKLESR